MALRPSRPPAPTRASILSRLADGFGYIAAVLTTVSFVPQVLHTWRARRAGGISLGMISLFSLGVALWLAYGILVRAWPVVAANAVTLALSLFLLGMKLRFDP
jgi:MtN3 and saliva related transmembrane protein